MKKYKPVKYSRPFRRFYASMPASEARRIKRMTEAEVESLIDEQEMMNMRRTGHLSWLDVPIRNLRGEVRQIFLDSGRLAEFLESTEYKDIKELRDLITPGDMFIINIPDREDSISVWLAPKGSTHGTDDGDLLIIQDGNGSQLCDIDTLTRRHGWYNMDSRMATENSAGDRKLNLVVNTFAYMSAFPDMVHDGLPKGCRIEQGASSRKTTLRTSPALVETRGTVPHMVRGHFRYLSSDFYTKEKRNTWTFVRSYFTGTKEVKTVEEK